MLVHVIGESQNVFPSNGNVGIGTTEPTYKLEVKGTAYVRDLIKLDNKLVVGAGEQAMTMQYVQGTSTFPPMFKFSAPGGTRPMSFPPEGGINSEDSQPNLTCLNGSVMPGFVNSFSQLISVAYNPTTSAVTGGQLLMGHNGINAFLETQGTGSLTTNVNHPGDLFINKFCNRNVMIFSHASPFATNITNVVSIDGSLNVRTKIQLGDQSSAVFSDPTCKMYIYNSVGAAANGIRIKHGSAGSSAIKLATFNDATAFTIAKGPNSSSNPTNDGPVTFKIESDGKTQIGTLSQNTSPIHSDASLTVNGKIVAKSCYITMNNWSDYVFNSDYELPELSDVEAYYKKHKHLQDIPSEKEVLERGIELSEMNNLLLKKIEELTIYTVEQDKRLSILQREIAAIKESLKK